jgi:shikimate dehydrogenase
MDFDDDKIIQINGDTELFGVIGYPVRNSLSPIIQNLAFRSTGMNSVYLAFEVEPKKLTTAISGFVAIGVIGLNVTMPYKVVCIKYMDFLDEYSVKTGAVNTIHFKEGKLYGYNTDGAGFISSLNRNGIDPKGMSALILGAGGAARAVAIALARSGAREIIIANRTRKNSEKLKYLINENFRDIGVIAAINYEDYYKYAQRADIIVNCTSIGMNSSDIPIDSVVLESSHIVFDLVYYPLETSLLRAARQKGARAISGVEMLVFQGAESFRIWTGIEPPYEKMLEAANRNIKGDIY